MEKIEMLTKALDANAFDTSDTSAGYINPEYWNRRVLDHVQSNMIVSQFATSYDDLLGDGDALNVTVRQEPAAAAAVAESAATTITAWAVDTVVFTPTEYSKAYELSDKERKRAFFSVMEAMTRDIGYSLALAMDTQAVTELQTNAGNAVVANGVASTAVASSDTMDHEDILEGMKANAVDKFTGHRALFVSPHQKVDLMKDTQFLSADKFGSGTVPQNGLLGQVFGIPVYETTQITVTSNKAKAILISDMDSFGIARKPFEGVRSQREELDRKTQLVGTWDFDVNVLRANSVCTIETYAA